MADFETGKPSTGEAGKILKYLQKDRRIDKGMKYSPVFGRYSFIDKTSEGASINVGDEVRVTRRNERNTSFGEFPSYSSKTSQDMLVLIDDRLALFHDELRESVLFSCPLATYLYSFDFSCRRFGP